MEKRAVATLVTGAPWQQLAEITLPSQRQYAERLQAEFIVMDKQVYEHPQYDKWQLYDLLAAYDRVLFLDADTIVRPDCPDVFTSVPPELLAGENELLTCPGQAQHLAHFCERLGIGPLPCPFYLNSGVLVASAGHRHVFRAPERILPDLPWPEQTHFNARLIAEKVPVCFLSSAFNDRHRKADYLRRSYILHYACLTHDKRLSAIQGDLYAWDRLFQRSGEPPDQSSLIADYDYVSPGLESIRCDRFFPHLIVAEKSSCTWPFFRRAIPHRYYADRRLPSVGFLNRDEAQLLYNTALRFRGRPALEIGCWMGWSACHLALGGVQLDVIDPLLGRPDFYASVADSLNAAGVGNRVNLVPGRSPDKVHEQAGKNSRPWSLFFIDGNHESPHPLLDTMACESHAAEDAMMVFHDLVSPAVAEGYAYLQEKGWQTLLYQTAQIMGVAWRGNVQPVQHVPDPNVSWQWPPHLRCDPVSGQKSRSDAVP